VTSTLAGYAAGSWRERGLGDILVPRRVASGTSGPSANDVYRNATRQRPGNVSRLQSIPLKSKPPSPRYSRSSSIGQERTFCAKIGAFEPLFLLSFRFRFHLRNEIPEFQGGSKIEVRLCILRGKGTRTVQRIVEGISVDRGFADPRTVFAGLCAVFSFPLGCRALGRLRARIERRGHIEGSCSRHARHEGESQVLNTESRR
jgi:hypothetical protein